MIKNSTKAGAYTRGSKSSQPDCFDPPPCEGVLTLVGIRIPPLFAPAGGVKAIGGAPKESGGGDVVGAGVIFQEGAGRGCGGGVNMLGMLPLGVEDNEDSDTL